MELGQLIDEPLRLVGEGVVGEGLDARVAGVVPGGLAVAVEGAVDALLLAGVPELGGDVDEFGLDGGDPAPAAEPPTIELAPS